MLTIPTDYRSSAEPPAINVVWASLAASTFSLTIIRASPHACTPPKVCPESGCVLPLQA
jgi:hypothetical protein